jgi:hypothetical protein
VITKERRVVREKYKHFLSPAVKKKTKMRNDGGGRRGERQTYDSANKENSVENRLIAQRSKIK